ncbi:M15 family metallopeptidase [Nocardioides donggukensis]|uniref:M15 family metallopeptidase n=1 Tax=Nocardioides donggukensis TaxID=2774019 RepID=A0A927Q0D3_9ACTN|nr:M15 family metallopeptidase [Nocardioides donggukensis]MBD8868787.1 M15 family metallopeptidase [Nocardioides donggukensis]
MAILRLPALVAVALLAPLLVLLPAAAGPAGAAEAAEPQPTTTTLAGPARKAGRTSPLDIAITTRDGAPVPGVPVLVERRVGGEWSRIAEPTTGPQGHATVEAELRRVRTDNVFRARFAGDGDYAASGSGRVRIGLVRYGSRITLGGPDSVVDEQQVTLDVSWRTGSGLPVPGEVAVQRRQGGRWKITRTVRTGVKGRASFTLRPRTDSRWRVVGRRQPWVEGDRSRGHAIDNLPPGNPVRLPSGAPRPRISLPKQPRATKAGPAAVITRIPDGVWNQMTGRSWHRGCPVGRAGLRLLRINYWDYQGYRRRGELVARVGAVGQMSAALKEMYSRKLPIRAMYRVDRFGWSSRLRGADDYKSMAAGNTSAFNCRNVVGRPGVRSPHSYGRALDLNPWENPYRASGRWHPNSWWVGRSHPRVAWRSRNHTVVRLMARHDLRWTYGTRDAHHFDAR